MNKTALIVGATGDIGREIAVVLSKEGYELVLCGHNGKFLTDRLCTKFSELRFDVSNPNEVKAAIEGLKKEGKEFDLVVMSAGVAEKEGLIIDKADEEIKKLVEVDLLGTIYVNKYVLSVMKKGGCIINISSFLGEIGCSCEASYSAAKGGIIALTKALAKEYAPFSVRVNCLSPGYIDTKMNDEFTKEERQRLIAQTPLGRLGTPNDVAQAVKLLAECDFITGENIMVTGGLVI